MQVTAVGRAQFANVVADGLRHFGDALNCRRTIRFYENRNVSEVHNACLGERLHGIEHAKMPCPTTKDVNRH